MFRHKNHPAALPGALEAMAAEWLPSSADDTIADLLESDQLLPLLRARDLIEKEGSHGAEMLVALLRRDIEAYRRSRRWLLALFLLVATLSALALGVSLCVSRPYVASVVVLLVIPAWLTCPFLIAWYDNHRTMRRRLNNVVSLLEIYRPLEATGPLLDALAFAETKTAMLAETALVEMLPQLNAGHTELLAERHYTCLRRVLGGCHSYLILAALHAIEQAGDRKALPQVQRLVACPVWLAESHTIQQAALQCALALQQHTKN